MQIQENDLIQLHNIAHDVYAPLSGFMKKDDTESVIRDMRLADGTLWSIPVLLHVDEDEVGSMSNGSSIEVTYREEVVAKIHNAELYEIDKDAYCSSVYGTTDSQHPGVQKMQWSSKWVAWGEVELTDNFELVFEWVQPNQLLTPKQTKAYFEEKGFRTVCAFQTRNPPHRGHEYIQKCSLEGCDALMIHPVVGEKKAGDFKDEYILGSYERIVQQYYNKDRTLLTCLPWIMQYAGPKEAIMHAIIRQNFGCTHMIIGRDHAGVGDYYGTYEAQEIFDKLRPDDLQIQILRYDNASYCKTCRTVTSNKTCPHENDQRIFISGTKLRGMIKGKEDIPRDFMRQCVQDYLKSAESPFVE